LDIGLGFHELDELFFSAVVKLLLSAVLNTGYKKRIALTKISSWAAYALFSSKWGMFFIRLLRKKNIIIDLIAAETRKCGNFLMSGLTRRIPDGGVAGSWSFLPGKFSLSSETINSSTSAPMQQFLPEVPQLILKSPEECVIHTLGG
jgi:hypothetical protein